MNESETRGVNTDLDNDDVDSNLGRGRHGVVVVDVGGFGVGTAGQQLGQTLLVLHLQHPDSNVIDGDTTFTRTWSD